MSFPSRLGGHAALLGQMLRCCGVEAGRLPGEDGLPGFVATARRCMACTEPARCRRWLEARAPDGSHAPPAFCPNAERLRQAVAPPA